MGVDDDREAMHRYHKILKEADRAVDLICDSCRYITPAGMMLALISLYHASKQENRELHDSLEKIYIKANDDGG